MPYKIKSGISPSPSVSEASDFMEVNAWMNGSYSALALQKEISRESDQLDNEGLEDEDVDIENFSLEVLNEVQRRIESTSGVYPFELTEAGTVLKPLNNGSPAEALYRYLLLATRLSMDTERVQVGIDGTQLFERLSAIALSQYLGRDRSRAFVFGTAVSGSFREKVDDLCRQIGEGGRYSPPDDATPPVNDDGLDVVGWIPFEDRCSSQLTVFGQCKTGTSWNKEISRLNPFTFTSKWMLNQFTVPPIKAYFVAESAAFSRWNEFAYNANLFFDRCRIVSCLKEIDGSPANVAIFDEVKNWSEAALKATEGV